MQETQWDEAIVMAENDWSVIPIINPAKHPETKEKVPYVAWRGYQEERAGDAQIEYWRERYPDALIGAITGAISGFVVVDCDSEESIAYAKECGVWSPVRVRTRRGLHLLFRHPQDGRRFGPRVGSNSTGYDWPKFPGLDFRGDGSYVVCYNAPNYRVDCDPGHSIFERDDMPEWKGWPVDRDDNDVENLDLSTSRIIDGTTEWERTAQYVADHYPGAKIPTGASNGRNQRVAIWAGECVAAGIYGADLEQRVHAFMQAFFMDDLAAEEWKATCRSVEAAERRNHPERVERNEAKAKPAPEPEELSTKINETTSPQPVSLLRFTDAPALAAAAAAQPYLVEPWLPVASIVHVSGYTGHGKSMVVSHVMANAAVGTPAIGPFEITRPCSVLYLDYENGRATLSRRMDGMLKAYGDPGDRFGLWSPWLAATDMPLYDNESLKQLSRLIKFQKPDVVVIDTVRSSYPGLDENSAEAWAPINKMVKRLQTYGIASIVLHHKNKPQNGGSFSREAGSTAQLNMVETQLYVTQVYKDKNRADANAAIHDETFYDDPVWPRMERKAQGELGHDWVPVAIYEVRYGKVREWTDLHEDVQWMALCMNLLTGDERMIGTASIKQKARHMYASGSSDVDVSRKLGKPLFSVRKWLGL